MVIRRELLEKTLGLKRKDIARPMTAEEQRQMTDSRVVGSFHIENVKGNIGSPYRFGRIALTPSKMTEIATRVHTARTGGQIADRPESLGGLIVHDLMFHELNIPNAERVKLRAIFKPRRKNEPKDGVYLSVLRYLEAYPPAHAEERANELRRAAFTLGSAFQGYNQMHRSTVPPTRLMFTLPLTHMYLQAERLHLILTKIRTARSVLADTPVPFKARLEKVLKASYGDRW
ncbi:MAG: hypothetical protein ABH863_06330 [Candidatus Micrarchaeota archaeon]